MRAELGASDLIGSYRIEGTIASGGMGVVYRAAHVLLPRPAAIKVLRADVVGMRSATERMLQEARILELIDHPTVVKIYDVGQLPDGRPWVAMELLDGQTLADHLFVHKQLPPPEVARIVLSVADALMRSHSAGVVHRDVKPENIMLVAGPSELEVKVIDWGIARLATATRRLTQLDYSPGTPHYMSPEQLRGQPVDGSTDTYALGVVTYEMLSGEPPFDGPTPLDIAVKTLQNAIPSLPSQLDLPPQIDGLIRGMLAKSPAERPSLDRVYAAFADWRRECEADYEDLHLEVEIDVDFGDEWAAGLRHV
jgi:serine/threonine protein kinase